MNDKLRQWSELQSIRVMLAAVMAISWGFRLEAIPPPHSPLEASAGNISATPGSPAQVQSVATNTTPPSGKIVPTPKAEPARSSLSSDQRLQRTVRRLLQEDPRTRSFASHATVKNGRLTLAVRTYSKRARDTAESAAARVPGVLAVRNLIVVESNADLEIAKKLHTAFSQDPVVHDAAIGVTVINRKVYFSGNIGSTEQRDRANAIAFSIPDIVAVSNGLVPSTTSKSIAARSPLAARSYSAFGPAYR